MIGCVPVCLFIVYCVVEHNIVCAIHGNYGGSGVKTKALLFCQEFHGKLRTWLWSLCKIGFLNSKVEFIPFMHIEGCANMIVSNRIFYNIKNEDVLKNQDDLKDVHEPKKEENSKSEDYFKIKTTPKMKR